jgi:hypothetical protein
VCVRCRVVRAALAAPGGAVFCPKCLITVGLRCASENGMGPSLRVPLPAAVVRTPTEQPPGQRWAGARTSHGEIGAARDALFCSQRDQPAQSMLCVLNGPLARISSAPSARARCP